MIAQPVSDKNGPIVSGVIEENRLGGAANVALNVKAMGAVPILCSVIGDDNRGQIFLDLMEEQYLTDVGLVVDEDRVTTQKTRIISGNQHLLRVDEEMDSFLNGRVMDPETEFDAVRNVGIRDQGAPGYPGKPAPCDSFPVR